MPSLDDAAKPALISLTGPVAHLLARLEAGWHPLPFDLPSVSHVLVDEKNFTRQLVSVRLVADTVEVRLRGHRTRQLPERLHSIYAHTADGGLLIGRVAHNATHRQVNDEEQTSEVLLRCLEWAYTPPTIPVLWAAQLQSVNELPGLGNLAIRRQNVSQISTSSGHLRLQRPGLLSYFIATNARAATERVWLCLDGQATESTLEQLSVDCQLFRVLLNLPIRPGIFYGLDAEGRTIAARRAVDQSAAREVNSGLQALVPVRYNQLIEHRYQVWLVPFYERLYAQYTRHGTANPVSYSLARYAHTLAQFDLDTQYELVAGAVTVLVKALIGQRDNSARVRAAERADSQLVRWLATNASERENDAGTLTRYAELLALQAERAMLTDLDPQAGPLVADELVEARKLFERGALSATTSAPPDRVAVRSFYNRLQLLRRAYAVLLARIIGYQGPVSRFLTAELDEQAGWLRSELASPEIRQQAEQFYMIDEDLSGLTIWPSFTLPALPEIPLLHRFVAFADSLRQSTRDKVLARLRPLPRRGDDPYRFSFRLMVNKAPTSQVALFTVELTSTGLVVRGWKDKPIQLTSEAELADFEHKLSHSAEFDEQIQRLLLIEEDLERGEA